MADAWKIDRRQGVCADTERAFAEGEEVYSLLRVVDGALQRADLCRAAFDVRDTAADVVYWRTVHRARPGAGLKVDFDVLLAAMEALAQDTREDRRDLAYLLSLLLVRHRRLRLERVDVTDGQETMVLRRVRSQQRYVVPSRELDDERRRALTATLAELLDPTREEGLDQVLGAAGEDVEPD